MLDVVRDYKQLFLPKMTFYNITRYLHLSKICHHGPTTPNRPDIPMDRL